MPPKKKASEAPAPVAAEDISMAEAPAPAGQAPDVEDDGDQLVVGEQRIRVVSFIWSAEFHLGR